MYESKVLLQYFIYVNTLYYLIEKLPLVIFAIRLFIPRQISLNVNS